MNRITDSAKEDVLRGFSLEALALQQMVCLQIKWKLNLLKFLNMNFLN